MQIAPANPLPRFFWLAAPPLAVVAVLLLWRSVWAVFAVYHVGICLLLPLAVNLGWRRLSWREHFARLALSGPSTGRWIGWGFVLLVALGVATAAALHGFGPPLLANDRVAATLAVWGVGPDRHGALLGFMILANGPAEESYWRGFIQTEFPETRRRFPVMPLASVAYAGYHAFTVHILLDSPVTTALFTVAVALAGTTWAWLRQRTGSAWPPLLAHLGATAGYMLFARKMLPV